MSYLLIVGGEYLMLTIFGILFITKKIYDYRTPTNSNMDLSLLLQEMNQLRL